MRTWLFNHLEIAVDDKAPGGVHEGESLLSTPASKPFVTYNIGNSTDEMLSDEPLGPERQFFQVYVHDEGGDYSAIDDLVWMIRQELEGKSDKDSGVMQVYHLETSRDLDDSTMNTILRYIRFQAIRARRTS